MKNDVFVWEVLQISCFRKSLILMFSRSVQKTSTKPTEDAIFKKTRILCKYHMKNDREVSWEPPEPLGVFFFGVRRRPKNRPELQKLTKKRPMPFRGSFWASQGPSRGPFRYQFRIRFYVLRDLSPNSESLNSTLWTTVIIRQGPPKNCGAVVTRR